jgi:alkylated DNA repair dioxygenase AlkB
MNNKNIKYFNNFLFKNEEKLILNWLNTRKFKKGINNDKSVIKRSQIWYQKQQKPFNKDWEKYDRWCSEKEYDIFLIYFEYIIELFLKKHNINDIKLNINSCLINKYKDGSEFIKFHQDSTKAFGNNHFIILYSIGEERIMRFKNITNNNDIFDIKLKSNSLLIIYSEINSKYQHSILKDDTKNVRYSLTFREFIS